MNRRRMMVMGSKKFKPTDLPNLALWVSSDYGLYTDTTMTDPVTTEDQTVAAWRDRSSAGNSLTQDTAGNRPVYKTNLVNGKPGLRFSVAGATYLNKTTHTVSPSAPSTIFIVSKQTQSIKEGALVAWQNGSSKGFVCRNLANRYSPRFTINGVAHLDGKISSWKSTGFSVTTWKWDTSHKMSFYTNGGARGVTTGAQDTNAGSAPFRVGGTGSANDFFGGDIAEVIIYNSELSDSNRNKVERYLCQKYNIKFTQTLNASTYLTTPTYDASGQAIHPDVIDFGASPWNGYRYWMAMTPFTGSNNTVENPSILCSNDGNTWVLPAGLTNPIDAAPGGGAFNSDACIVMSADNITMYCIYREAKTDTNYKIKLRSSTDGVTWSAESEIISGAASSILSPSVIWDGSQFVMWSVDQSGAFPYKILKRTCATIDGAWSAASDCTILNPGQSIKHICVRLLNGVYHAITMDVDEANGFTGAYYATSTDGDNWTYDPGFRIPPGTTGSWDDTEIYRSTLAPGATTLDIWYSARSGTVWHTGRTSYMP